MSSAAYPLFDGRVVVVVGGGQGIGRQYCRDLGLAGARVVVASRSANADLVADDVRAAGGTAAAIVADARDGDAIVAGALAAFGHIDALIVNAGIVRDRSFARMTAEDWREVIDVHLNGSFACARAAWAPMKAAGGGAILLTTSGAGMHGAFGQANYAAAKGGMIGLAKTLAIEGERANIRVNAIAPMAQTAMTDAVFPDDLKARLRTEDLSPFALALIHPDCDLTGAVIETGGGWAAAMRWERSVGIRLSRPDPAAALAALSAAADFTRGSDSPSSTADSLGAAMGRPRAIRSWREE